MPTGNDSNSSNLAKSNCAFCAIGGLVGKSASDIIRMVYAELGEPLPDGFKDDGTEAFIRYHYKLNPNVKKSSLGKDTIQYQIEGIRAFLQRKGCRVETTNLLTLDNAEKYVNEQPEGTLFLVLAGEDDGFGIISSMAHWTTCQVQNGKGVYYDYQTKISDINVRDIVKQEGKKYKVNMEFDDTRVSDKIIAPLGQNYNRNDGRAIILKVAK